MTDHHSLLAGEWKPKRYVGMFAASYGTSPLVVKNPKGMNTEENGLES